MDVNQLMVNVNSWVKDILKENYVQCSAMLIKTDVVKRFMFSTEFFHEDYVLGLDMLRAGEKGNVVVLLPDCGERYLSTDLFFEK